MTEKSTETVLVIGAGIIGIACAHYLLEAGYNVTVIDKGTIAHGCSYGNCGHILPSHVLPLNSPQALRKGISSLWNPGSPLRVSLKFDLSFINWLWQFSRRCYGDHASHVVKNLEPLLASSWDAYKHLVKDNNISCDWNPSGLFYGFRSSKSLDGFSLTNDWLSAEIGLEASYACRDDIQTRYPSLSEGVIGGFYYREDGSLRPDLLTYDWSKHLKCQGVTFIENCEFSSLEMSQNLITAIQTSHGRISADHIVLAAGAMSSNFAQAFHCSIPVEPGKGYSITFPKPENHTDTSLVFPEASLALTTFNDQLRIGSMLEFVGFDETLRADRTSQLKKWAEPYFKRELSNAGIKSWYGWRPMTWDSLPIIGRVPSIKNAFIATGHNMIGMMSAPATGRLISEMIQERRPHIDCEVFSPNRFN